MENTNTKSFWEKPEGTTGKVVVGIIALVIAYVAYQALPHIILLLQNTLYAIVLAITTLVAVLTLLNPRFQANCGAIFQIVMYKMTDAIIKINPIAVIEGHLADLEVNLSKMSEQLDLLKGQEKKLVEKIRSNSSGVQQAIERASYTKKKLEQAKPNSAEYVSLKGSAALDGNKAARFEQSNSRLNEVLSKIVKLRDILEKMFASSRFVLDDMSEDVKLRKEEREAITKASSAFKSAMTVLRGDKDKRCLYDESMEFLATDLGNKVGEIERFMENSGSFLTSMDIDKEMFTNKGLQMIDDWEKKVDTFIVSPISHTQSTTEQNSSSNSYIK